MAENWFKGLFGQPQGKKAPSLEAAEVTEAFARAISLHQEGHLEEAAAGFDRVLRIRPDHFDALHLSGVIKLQLGRYEEAVASISKAIETNPDQPSPYSNLGLAMQKLGRTGEAIALYDHALAMQSDFRDALFNRGNACREFKRFHEALENYDKAIALSPGDSQALNNRGLTLSDLGRHQDAIVSFDQALLTNVDHVDALMNRGTALCALNRFEEALVSFDKVISIRQDHAKSNNNRGIALGGLRRYEDALLSYQRALEIDPHFAEALYNQGAMLSMMGRNEAALASFDQAIALKPDYTQALNARGTAYRNLSRHLEALASYDQALGVKPDYPEALDNRGVVLAALARHADALVSHERALALRPGFSQALGNRATVLRETGERSAAIDGYRQAADADPESLAIRFKLVMASIPVLAKNDLEIEQSRVELQDGLEMLEKWSRSAGQGQEDHAVGAMQPFHLAYQEKNNRNLLAQYGAICTRLMQTWQERNRLIRCAPVSRGGPRIRLGIVSAHVHNHSVWNAIVRGWLEKIDKQKFEINVFHLGSQQDEETAFAKASCDHYESGERNLKAWATSIGNRTPDMLIYPEIGMDVTTVRLASMRLAPIQIAAWGHPETTGLPTMDYYLSAECFESAESQECYTEKLIALPNLGCHYTPTQVEIKEVDFSALGIHSASLVFVCPGTPSKYSPQDDIVFVDIARRLDRAQFVLFNYEPVPTLSKLLHERLASSFEAAGLDWSKHLVFVPWQPKAQFYALLRQADAFLDTFGFSGFNTAMQAIECGLPIVTCEGRFMRGRFASAILKRMALDELVTETHQSYVDLAVRLARDRPFNARVRAKIRKSSPVLYRDPAPIRALEDFLTGLRPLTPAKN